MNRSGWLNLKHNRYNLCVSHVQAIVKSHEQHTYFRREFYANTSFSPEVLCNAANIYAHEFGWISYETLAFCEIKFSHKIPSPPKPCGPGFNMQMFQIFFARCTKWQVLIKAKKYSCSQNLGRLNRKQSEFILRNGKQPLLLRYIFYCFSSAARGN